MLNSPLRQAPREQRAAVIPSRNESSLLDWLEASGRLIARDVQEPEYREEEDIPELMPLEDVPYDDIEEDEDLDPQEI